MAGVLIDILSAPRFNICLASSTDLMPPATQKGMLTTSAIFEIQFFSTIESLVLADIS